MKKQVERIFKEWFEEPSKIPKEDEELLEKTFEAIEFGHLDSIPKGVKIVKEGIQLPNGKIYKCLPFGWKKIRQIKMIPRCPHCNKPLEVVYVTCYENYGWENGKYKLTSESEEVFCPYCDKELSELFPEGVCNWGK